MRKTLSKTNFTNYRHILRKILEKLIPYFDKKNQKLKKKKASSHRLLA